MLTLALVIFPLVAQVGEGPSLQEARSFGGELSGEISIRRIEGADSPEEISLLVTTHINSGRAIIENPFWFNTHGETGRVAVFDARQQFIGWLRRPEPETEASQTMTVSKGAMIGALFSVPHRESTRIDHDSGKPVIAALGVGEYYLQAELTGRFIKNRQPSGVISISKPLKLLVTKEMPIETVVHMPGGIALISTDRKVVNLGESFQVSGMYINTSANSVQVYNPTFESLANRFGAALMLTRPGQQQVCDLLMSWGGSAIISGPMDLPPGAMAGRRFEIVAGKCPFPFRGQPIGTGEYELQFGCTECFFADETDEGMTCRNGRAVVLSNALDLEFVD